MIKLQFPKGLRIHVFFLWFGILNFTGGYALVYWGEKYIASGLTSVLFSVMPFYVLVLSIWLLPQETVNLKKIAGVVLIAPIFSSMGTITAKRKGTNFHPIVLITIPMLYSAIFFFILSATFERHSHPVFDFNAVFSIIYLALFGTVIAFILYFWMLKNTSAVLMSMITFVTPPLALIWGWALLNEFISYFLILGLMIIFSGIVLAKKN
jgi:drug/metabolite transporter (DMT)-like permease